MAEKAVDIPAKAEPVGAGKPVEGVAVTQLGSTFAERSGKKPPAAAKKANTTFADRAKGSKAVDSGEAEDKSVKSAAKKS